MIPDPTVQKIIRDLVRQCESIVNSELPPQLPSLDRLLPTHLEHGTATLTCLRIGGIHTTEQLLRLTHRDVRRIAGIGTVRYLVLRSALERNGLGLVWAPKWKGLK